MVAPSLLMLSVFCACETELSASAPSANAILLFFMIPLLGWLVLDGHEHSGCYGAGLPNQMGEHTLVRVNRPAAVDKRPVSARRRNLEKRAQRVLGFLQEGKGPGHRVLG